MYKQFVESIDHRLNGWENKAKALEAQFDGDRAAVLNRIEVQKHRTSDALDRARVVFSRSTELGQDIKDKILTDLDQLKVQLALGKMETRQAYQRQRKSIANAVAQFEADLDVEASAANRVLDEAIDQWVDEEIALEAEIEAAEIHWALDQEDRRQEWEDGKQEMKDRLQAFRQQLDENHSVSQDKLEAFAHQAGAGFEQIQQAFKKLIS